MHYNTFLSRYMFQPLLSKTTNHCQTYLSDTSIPLLLSAFQGTSTPCLWLPNNSYSLIYNLKQNYPLDLPSTISPRELTFERNCPYFAVTFPPSILPLDALKANSYLIQSLSAQSTFSAQISCLFSVLNPDLHLNFSPFIIQEILTAISAANGSISIRQLSQMLSYSERHINRLFHSYMNYSPKTFIRILRFQNSLQEILKMPNRNNSEFIHSLSYSDQAHFQREFKSFTTMTPRRFIQFLQK